MVGPIVAVVSLIVAAVLITALGPITGAAVWLVLIALFGVACKRLIRFVGDHPTDPPSATL